MSETRRPLPPGWRWSTLEQTLSLADSGVWGDEDNESGISVLRSTNFRNDGTLDLERLTFRAIPDAKREQKLLKVSDILLERSGGGPLQPVGRVCQYDGDARQHSFGNFCQRLRVDDTVCFARFLFWYLHYFHISGQTAFFQKQTTGIRNLEFGRYLSQPIPLPPFPEQQRIAARLGEQMAAVERARRAAEERLAAAAALPAAYLRRAFPPPGQPLPAGWRWARLGEVCEINPRRPQMERPDTTPTSFVPMEAVDALFGTIAEARVRPFGEIKKGYTYFAEGDVLFAKITPCMQNGKHAIARGLTDGIGFGTTEFHVLRPKESTTAEWIHFFVRQPELLQKATEHFTGAVGQQRLPPDYLASLEIPLPPLPEQRRIAAALGEQMAAVERARRAAENELATINALPAALLRRAFAGEA